MKALLITLLCTVFTTGFSQVTGRLVNSSGQPIPNASVLIINNTDTALAKSTATNDSGVYVFSRVAPAAYRLRFSSVGYQTMVSPVFQVSGVKDSIHMGTQLLPEEAAQLNNVVVRSAQKPVYQQQAEGTTVNVENSVLTKGSSVLEVLQRSPGVVIDQHNNAIMLNGKGGVTVTINGKPARMSMEQLLVMLNGMSANDISSIELLNTPPAKYDAEGSAGIINIVLKKDKKKGDNGSITATAGYGWGEKASGNLRFSHNTGKVETYASYSYSHNRSYNFLFGDGIETVPAFNGTATFLYKGESKPVDNSHNFNTGIDIKLTPKLAIGGSLSYNNSVSNRHSYNQTLYTILPDSILDFKGNITGRNTWKNYIASIYLEKQIAENEKLSLSGDYLRYDITSPTEVNASFVNKHGEGAEIGGDSLFSPSQKGYGKAVIQVGVVKVDYTKQLGKKVKLEAGLKGTYTKSASTSGIESYINGEWVSPTETVNKMVMQEGIAAGYASINTQLTPSTSLSIGMRYEYYDTHADDGKTGSVAFSRRLAQLFPSVFFTKKLDDNSSLQFSYTKRITRPSYNDLASYIAYNDPISVFTGNPLLKPTITNNIKLGYTYKNYALSLLYNRDDNAIVGGQVASSPSGYIAYIMPENITWQNAISLQANIPVRITNWWSMNNNLTYYWRQFNIEYTLQPVKKGYIGYSANTTQTFRLPKSYAIEISAHYNDPGYWAASKDLGNGSIDMGIKKDLKNNKGTLQLTVTDLLRTMYYQNEMGTLTRLVFDTKAYIKWSAESAKFPIIKLTYTRSFGTGQQRSERKDNLSDEKERVR